MSKPTTPEPDVCRLTLAIRHVDYRVTPSPTPTGRAWRLRRADGKGSCVVAETRAFPRRTATHSPG